jgi:ribonucleoside-triphosphate reductase
MPRLAYLTKGDEKEFFPLLEKYMILAKNSLEIKRKMLENNLGRGLYPYTARYLASFKNHFSTIGLVGVNEACLNILGEDITSKNGHKFALAVLDFMRDKIVSFQQETGNLYNLEATPAEGASYRLAKIDKEELPAIITAGTDGAPYYTNSTQLPVSYTNDSILALELQERLQTKYTGGTVFHLFLGEAIAEVESCKLLVKRILSHYRIPYLSITPTFSVCLNHGYLKGENWHCPECGSECEVYSRVVGYYRPVANWNKGKQEEYRQRRYYNLESF